MCSDPVQRRCDAVPKTMGFSTFTAVRGLSQDQRSCRHGQRDRGIQREEIFLGELNFAMLRISQNPVKLLGKKGNPSNYRGFWTLKLEFFFGVFGLWESFFSRVSGP